MTKELKDYEEEIYKCSRCGLCQSVCPVYKATLNECSVSKAKFTMLNGMLKGDLELNERIKKYMDLCTGCNACKDFCPSAIDAREIFTAVKIQYNKNNPAPIWEKMANSYFIFKNLLRCANFSFVLYRFFHMDYLAKIFYKFLPDRLLLLNSLIKKPVNGGKAKNGNKEHFRRSVSFTNEETAIYFPGCFNKYLNSSSKNALKIIFSQLGINFVEKDFECCGISYLSAGDIEEFQKLAKKNLELSGNNYDYVLTDCASCNYILKEYEKYFPSDESKRLARKTISVLEFLKNAKIKSKRPMSVTAHKPCHEDFDFTELIKSIEGVNYIEAEDFDKCCGFSGKFALQNPDISKKISKKKAQMLLETEADCIITTCPACVLGINQGLIENKSNPRSQNMPVYNMIEFIALHCEITA